MATNIYKISASVVSAVITAMFGIAHEGYLYCKKQISKEQLMKNSLFIALETAASAGGAALGKDIFKKHPVIGAIAGSILGSAGIGCVRKTVFA